MKSSTLVIIFWLAILPSASFAQEVPAADPPAAAKAEQGIKQNRDYGPYPRPDRGYVTDLADLLSQQEEEQIEQWLWRVESQTGVEIAVVTISSLKEYSGTQNGSIESFATALFDNYGVGNLPKNDGVLLLISKQDRKARIELGKFHGKTRDADAARIMERVIVPRFKKEEYAAGVKDGVKAIAQEFAGVRIGVNWPLVALIVAVPVLGLIAFSLFRSGKRGWGWACVGLLVIVILAIVRIIYELGKHGSDGDSSSWGAGGFGGGFGGGSSGGGGATGSW
ncbi:MAG: YgcG family protein [Pirellulales bacterium]